MKELTIEEKARAYDEAYARMSKAYNDNRCSIGFMNEIFPRPKENDDERIRKDIIHLVKKSNERGGYALHKDEADKMIAWLEKQGGQSLANKDYSAELDWLKSLKPQKQWKPSEEQMNALDNIISSRDIKYDVLSELWKDLKQL